MHNRVMHMHVIYDGVKRARSFEEGEDRIANSPIPVWFRSAHAIKIEVHTLSDTARTQRERTRARARG